MAVLAALVAPGGRAWAQPNTASVIGRVTDAATGSPLDWLHWARNLGLERLDAQLLLSHHLQRDRTWLLAHDREALGLSPAQADALSAHLRQRADGVPLAYLTGEKEFFGLRFKVNPAVLVPRPDTEVLVEWALEHGTNTRSLRVLDLGTGSGAIALAVADQRPQWEVHASDRSPEALAVAQHNGQRLGLTVRWHLGSWFEALPSDARFDLLLSNPPYIAGNDPHLQALRYEPRQALTPEGDGLADLRTLVAGAAEHLTPEGWLLLEHGWDQGDAVAALLQAAGWREVQHRWDLGGHRRCTGGKRPV